MDHITLGFEVEDNEVWIFATRSFGRIETQALESPLHQILQWITEQLNFGCWEPKFDENGDAVTLILGKEAGHSFDEPILEHSRDYARKRLYAVNIAGLFAKAREAGVDQESSAMIEESRISAIENQPSPETVLDQIDAHHPANAWTNTEYHYAFSFIQMLQEMKEKMFVFSAPPIRNVLPKTISRLLAEATRAYLFGLNHSAVALCRVILEEAMRDQLDSNELLEYQKYCRSGELLCMIDLCRKKRIITEHACDQSHEIRKFGNEVMHLTINQEPSNDDTWKTLLKIRSVLEELCVQ